MHLGARQVHAARRMIKAQRTEVDPLPCRLGLGTRDSQVLVYPPQQYPDPGHQFPQAERLQPDLLEKAAAAGLRSLFVGFETVNADNLAEQRKWQNIDRDYGAAIRRLHDLGVMVNGSFVFGMDSDDPSVFDRTVGWAIEQGIETATFHILTPYPGTRLYQRMAKAGRLLHSDWDLYDTRHVVYQPARMTAQQLETGYWQAYRDFYRWGSIVRGARTKPTMRGTVRHAAYAGGWKKFEPCWDLVIRARRAGQALPLLEAVLSGFGASA